MAIWELLPALSSSKAKSHLCNLTLSSFSQNRVSLPPSAMSALEITGNLRKRYIQAAALLSLIDRVRGEPTSYGLDHESDSICDPADRVLKRKFLDAFALICASHKRNSRTISAACFDKEDRLKGTVVRIASNNGVSDATLASVRDIVAGLSDFTLKGMTLIPLYL